MTRKYLSLIAAALVIAVSQIGPLKAADWQAGAGPDWQKVLTAAKQEGTVVVTGPPQLTKEIVAGFERDTGIKLDYVAGEARATASRVVRELRANNVTIDVSLTGTAELPVAKEGFFEDEKVRLLLPGVTNTKNWAGGELKWVDNTKQFMLQTHAYRSAIPYFNPTILKPAEMTSWQKLLDPKLKGKIVVYDPRSGGPGRAMATYIATHLGLDYFKKLYVGQQVVYSLDSRQMAEWVVRGVHAVGLGILAPDYQRFKSQGITTIVPADFDDGAGTLTGGFSVIMLLKGAPHPNAQTVFLNWFASQPGQEAFTRAYNVPSRRVDVSVAGLPDHTILKPGRKYQDQYTEDWANSGVKEVQQKYIEIIGGK
jgi:ABC-type Fe3+ transport system substrate-binding protein